jgi:hypothetical protein
VDDEIGLERRRREVLGGWWVDIYKAIMDLGKWRA